MRPLKKSGGGGSHWLYKGKGPPKNVWEEGPASLGENNTAKEA